MGGGWDGVVYLGCGDCAEATGGTEVLGDRLIRKVGRAREAEQAFH
jgi:hypothetical protein